MLDFYEGNELCEICLANPLDYDVTYDVYWLNTHCMELRRNRSARENKKVEPINTVF